MTNRILAAVALALAAPAAAQLPTDQLDQHAGVVRQGILVDKTVNRNRGMTLEAKRERARATCANKHKAVENMGANHPTVRQLYALCAQAGF